MTFQENPPPQLSGNSPYSFIVDIFIRLIGTEYVKNLLNKKNNSYFGFQHSNK